MQIITPSVLETRRLILRQGKMSDAIYLYHNYTADPVCARFLTREAHENIIQTEQFINDWCISSWKEPKNQFSWIISLREKDQAVGVFIVKVDHQNAEIHYGIGQKFWNNGYVTEAGLAVVSWLKKQTNISKIWTFCEMTHYSSQNVLEKIGLENKGLIKNKLNFCALKNAAQDFFMFSLIV